MFDKTLFEGLGRSGLGLAGLIRDGRRPYKAIALLEPGHPTTLNAGSLPTQIEYYTCPHVRPRVPYSLGVHVLLVRILPV